MSKFIYTRVYGHFFKMRMVPCSVCHRTVCVKSAGKHRHLKQENTEGRKWILTAFRVSYVPLRAAISTKFIWFLLYQL